MKKILIIVLCLCFSFGLVGCKTSKVSTPEACDLATYKKYALPLMQELSDIVDKTDMSDASSRKAAKSSLQYLLFNINQVKCKNDFPLKHETLEYSVRHLIDAIDYADKGDYDEATLSINKATLNIENFLDWSVDVD